MCRWVTMRLFCSPLPGCKYISLLNAWCKWSKPPLFLFRSHEILTCTLSSTLNILRPKIWLEVCQQQFVIYFSGIKMLVSWIAVKSVPNSFINNKPGTVQLMHWRVGDTPVFEPAPAQLPETYTRHSASTNKLQRVTNFVTSSTSSIS